MTRQHLVRSAGAVGLLAGGAGLTLLAVSFLGTNPASSAGPKTAAADKPQTRSVRLLIQQVRKQPLDLTIAERGSLAAVVSADVVCQLKGTKGSTVATLIKRVLVEDGDSVKKGQPLLELDSSGLEDQLKTQQIARDGAKLALDQAESDLIITRLQNESDLELAKAANQIAKIDLEKYQVDYENALADVKARTVLAEAEVERRSDEAATGERLLKERKISEARARYLRLSLDSARLMLASRGNELAALKLTRKRTQIDREARTGEAQANLKRVKLTNDAREASARTSPQARKAAFHQEQVRLNGLKAEIAHCKMTAPRDGILVYHVPEQARFGGGVQQSIIAEGEPVREGQKLMEVVDLKKMQVALEIPGSVIAQVRTGMAAAVQVDAFPNRAFQGKVIRIATTSSRQNWLAMDIATFRVTVAIDGENLGLKPGMSAGVVITTGKKLPAALTVPVSALLPCGEAGHQRSCLVQTAKGVEEREVSVSFIAEKGAVVQSGLREGDEVVVNPRALLGDLKDRIQMLRRLDRSRRGGSR